MKKGFCQARAPTLKLRRKRKGLNINNPECNSG